jgi:hypothetical protein
MVAIDQDSSVLERLFGPVDPDIAIPHPLVTGWGRRVAFHAVCVAHASENERLC